MRTHQHTNKREIGWICTQVEVGSQRERKNIERGEGSCTLKQDRGRKMACFHRQGDVDSQRDRKDRKIGGFINTQTRER